MILQALPWTLPPLGILLALALIVTLDERYLRP